MRSAPFDEPADRLSPVSWPSVVLQQAVLAALVGWANASGIACAVTELLARQLRVSERSIRRAIDALETLGHIERTAVPGWRALAFRISIREQAHEEPTEHELQARRIAALERELAQARGLAAEAHDARELLADAQIIPMAQRADADDERAAPPLAPGSDPQAAALQARYLEARKRKTGLGPASYRRPASDAWDAAVSICCALEADGEGAYADACASLCRVWFERGGRVAEERWPVAWMKFEHEKLLVDTRAELRRRRMRASARAAPPRPAQEAPRACPGVCTGGSFQNPLCADCGAAARLSAEHRDREEERGADAARARARERLDAWAAEQRAGLA